MSKQNKRRWWLHATLEILLLILLWLALRAWQQQGMSEGLAPQLREAMLNGEIFSLRDQDKRPVLVYFWASWCPVCKYQSPTVAALTQQYRVISVAMQSGSTAEVVRYLRKNGLHLPTINDPEGKLSSRWGIAGVPAIFILDKTGNIRFREVGYTFGPGLRCRLWLASK